MGKKVTHVKRDSEGNLRQKHNASAAVIIAPNLAIQKPHSLTKKFDRTCFDCVVNFVDGGVGQWNYKTVI